MTRSQATAEMITRVQSEMTADQLAAYVSDYCKNSAPLTAPEHDDYIATAALLGNRTAMLLCHMA